MGKDLTEVRKQNLRSATNTLLFIITTYLIANTLDFVMTIVEFWYPSKVTVVINFYTVKILL